MSPFRQAVGRCALCLEEVPTSDLAPVARLAACSRCREGSLHAAAHAHGFVLGASARPVRDLGGEEGETWRLDVGVRRPTELDTRATFSPEVAPSSWLGRLFAKPDPVIGVQDFDRLVRVEVEEHAQFQAAALLRSEGAREAILRLVEMGTRVEVGFHLDTAEAKAREEHDLPSTGVVTMYLLALSIHVEAHARKLRR